MRCQGGISPEGQWLEDTVTVEIPWQTETELQKWVRSGETFSLYIENNKPSLRPKATYDPTETQ
jgi:hypothetical protein